MHSRPMFPIMETQVGDGWVGDGWVGDGWVGDVDYTKQATKQDSNFLVDWVRVYQSEGQPVTRFDDLDGAESGAYRSAPASRTEGLTAVSNGDAAWRNKNNFYYGGQPRYETSRSHAVPLMQGRFALRLRGPQTLCRIRTNAFTRSERPVAGKVVPPNRRNRAAP